MDTFKLVYKILKQIHTLGLAEEPDLMLLSPDALKATKEERDDAILMMLDDELINGITVIKGIDGQQKPYILWRDSMPHITLKGLQYLEENSMMKKAKNLLKGFVEIIK